MTNTKKLVKIDKSVKFTPVKSSMIASYAREAGDLAVKFTGGGTYVYKSVDQSTVDSFLAAASKGRYFTANIKNKFVAEQAE